MYLPVYTLVHTLAKYSVYTWQRAAVYRMGYTYKSKTTGLEEER